MRQRTRRVVETVRAPISELPMRQRTVAQGAVAPVRLSELPMRQRTQRVVPVLELVRF